MKAAEPHCIAFVNSIFLLPLSLLEPSPFSALCCLPTLIDIESTRSCGGARGKAYAFPLDLSDLENFIAVPFVLWEVFCLF